MPERMTVRSGKAATRQRLERISAYQLGRPKARLGNPNTGIPEVVVQPIYDIYFVANATAMPLLTLFSVPVGQTYNFGGVTAFLKTFGHTNLVQAGMLESSYTFVVRALSIYMQALQGTAQLYLNYTDYANLASSRAQFNINRKSYYDGIIGWLPGGGGGNFAGGGVGSTTQATYNTTNGVPYSRNVYPLPGGQFINPQENFNFIIDPTGNAGGTPSTATVVLPGITAPASGISAWVRLDGTLIRVAQ